MKVKKRTNDSFRVMGYLSENGETSVHEMKASLEIDEGYLSKILRRLCENGLVVSGIEEVFKLAVKPEDITVLELMEVMEGTMKISPILEQGSEGIPEKLVGDVLYRVYEGFQNWLEEKLSAITLRDLLEPAK
jgi:Rrf2 family protein